MTAEVRPVFAIDRVKAYLAEVERKNAVRASQPNRGELDDAVHAINDFELRRSDIALILARLTVVEDALVDVMATHEAVYPHGQYEVYDGYTMASAIARARNATGL